LLSEADINYYLDAQPPEFLAAVGIGAALGLGFAAVALLLFVRWLFSLPLLLLRHQGVMHSLRESAHLSRRFFWKAAPPLALWLVFLFALLFAGGWLLKEANSGRARATTSVRPRMPPAPRIS